MHTETTSSYPHIAELARLHGKDVWIYDLEATNGDLSDPQFGIVEIGWVRVNRDGTSSEGQSWVDPGYPMNPFAERLTGISRSDYQGAMTFREFWPAIREHWNSCIVSGFGINDMDLRAIHRQFEGGWAIDDQAALIDSLDARRLWIEHSQSSRGQLAEVAAAFGHHSPNAHRALADAKMAAAAIDGLVEAMGAKACLRMARIGWHPAENMDNQRELSLRNQREFEQALAIAFTLPGLEQALDTLEADGFRPHHSAKGFNWWRGTARMDSALAPKSPDELAARVGIQPPENWIQPDAIERCKSLLATHGNLSDRDIAKLALCKSEGYCAAARSKLIRDGLLQPWSGIPQELRAFAEQTVASHPTPLADERSILEALRAVAPDTLKGIPAIGAAAASLACIAKLPRKLPKP